MQNNIIGVSNLPNLLHNEFSFRGCSFNMMVVGSHGLGKTTFINKLLETGVIKKQPFDCPYDNPFWITESKCNIQTSSIEIRENGFTIRLNITEVDGIGDCVDNRDCYKPVVELLESNFNDYHQKFKEQTRSVIDDKRIHVCFYFLEPVFAIKKPDLETLKHISPHCTVVPIIAKSDLISRDQVLDLKTCIRGILKDNNIPFFEDIEGQAEAPFVVFSEIRDDDSLRNSEWAPTSFNTQTNDFIPLKRLIIERSAIDLIKETDQYYDNYRISRLIMNSTDKEIIAMKERVEKKIKEYQDKISRIQKRICEHDGIQAEIQ